MVTDFLLTRVVKYQLYRRHRPNDDDPDKGPNYAP